MLYYLHYVEDTVPEFKDLARSMASILMYGEIEESLQLVPFTSRTEPRARVGLSVSTATSAVFFPVHSKNSTRDFIDQFENSRLHVSKYSVPLGCRDG